MTRPPFHLTDVAFAVELFITRLRDPSRGRIGAFALVLQLPPESPLRALILAKGI